MDLVWLTVRLGSPLVRHPRDRLARPKRALDDGAIVLRAERRIVFVRGIKVLLDADLAELYEVPTRRLNEQVRRNRSRFRTRLHAGAVGRRGRRLEIAICDVKAWPWRQGSAIEPNAHDGVAFWKAGAGLPVRILGRMPPGEKELQARVAFLPPSSGNEARAFLQERLALLGRVYALLAARVPGGREHWRSPCSREAGSRRASTSAAGSCSAARPWPAGLWWVCRRGPRSEPELLAADAVATTLIALLQRCARLRRVSGRAAGLGHTRAGWSASPWALVLRAIVVPSSPRRTLGWASWPPR